MISCSLLRARDDDGEGVAIVHLMHRVMVKWNVLPSMGNAASVSSIGAPMTGIRCFNKSPSTDDNLKRACRRIGVGISLIALVVDSQETSSARKIIALSDNNVSMNFLSHVASVRVRSDKMEENACSRLKMCAP